MKSETGVDKKKIRRFHYRMWLEDRYDLYSDRRVGRVVSASVKYRSMIAEHCPRVVGVLGGTDQMFVISILVQRYMLRYYKANLFMPDKEGQEFFSNLISRIIKKQREKGFLCSHRDLYIHFMPREVNGLDEFKLLRRADGVEAIVWFSGKMIFLTSTQEMVFRKVVLVLRKVTAMADYESTASLRSTLFEVLDKLVKGEIEHQDAIAACKVADNIVKSAALEIKFAEVSSQLRESGIDVTPIRLTGSTTGNLPTRTMSVVEQRRYITEALRKGTDYATIAKTAMVPISEVEAIAGSSDMNIF